MGCCCTEWQCIVFIFFTLYHTLKKPCLFYIENGTVATTKRKNCSPWWRHQMETFSASLALCAGTSPVTGEFPSQRPATPSLMFSSICAWTNGWVNNRNAGDWRRHWAHYDVILVHRSVNYDNHQCQKWRQSCHLEHSFCSLAIHEMLWRSWAALVGALRVSCLTPNHYLNDGTFPRFSVESSCFVYMCQITGLWLTKTMATYY